MGGSVAPGSDCVLCSCNIIARANIISRLAVPASNAMLWVCALLPRRSVVAMNATTGWCVGARHISTFRALPGTTR